MITLLPTANRCYRTPDSAIEDLRLGVEFQTVNGITITLSMFPKLLRRTARIVLFYDTINGGEVDVTEIKPASKNRGAS